MKRLIILFIMALFILTSHSQILPPDIKKATYPVVETNDSSLNSTIKEAIAILYRETSGPHLYNYTDDSLRLWSFDIVVDFSDSIPASGQFIANAYVAFDAQIFLTFRIFNKNSPRPKEYYGISYENCQDMVCRVFYSGKIAKDLYHQKGNEICSYEYDANEFFCGEFRKISIMYNNGVWSVIPNSLEWY